ncbi:g4743 [Coccomyxa elongata]
MSAAEAASPPQKGEVEHSALLSEQNVASPRNKNTMAKALSPAMLQLATVVACVGWMGVSSGLIMVNKYLMSTDGFHYPMALSCLGMLFSSVASYIACRVIKVVEVNRVLTWRFYFARILPVGFFMALTLHFGNIVYLYLTVSFIQMLKAFTPIITMLALFVARLEDPSQRLIVAVLLIALGTAMASYGEVNMSWLGLTFMFASETFEAIRLVMTQMLLVGLKFHPIEGLMYLAPACSLWLLLGIALVEWPRMAAENALGLIAAKPLLYMSAAAMGFGVNSLAYIVIQLASSLTLKVLGTVKNALVVWMGIIFLAELVTPLQGFGYAVSLAGFFWYNYIKMQKGSPAAPVVTPPRRSDYTIVSERDPDSRKGEV